MYELTEYGLVLLVAVMAGGFSFMAGATVLAIMEGVKAVHRKLRAGKSPTCALASSS